MPALLARPTIDNATRREFLAMLAAAGLLTGCAGAAPTAPPAAATRVVETPRGPVTIPADPQRIYAAYTHDFWNALALGLPIAAGTGDYGQPGAPVPGYILDQFPQAATIELLPHSPELDVERIAALAPDVILTSIFGDFDPGFAQLEAIAPVVTSRYSVGSDYAVAPWRDVLRQNGAQFGREIAAQEWIGRFDDRAQALRPRVAARWAGATWAVIEPYPDQVAVYGPRAGHISATLIDELGLTPAPSVAMLLAEAGEQAQGAASVSYERLAAVDADLLFVGSYVPLDAAASSAGLALLEAQPLWAGLPAVAAGRVHEFAQGVSYQSGPTATAFLDVVERALLG